MVDTAAAPELPLQYAPGELSDLELADELYEGTAILAMGRPEGIAAHVAADLRRRRLAAALEVVRRWDEAPT